MEVLITGGAGFIGSHLVRELAGTCEIVVFDNLSSGVKEHIPSSIELVIGDVCCRDDLERVFTAHSFSAVIHLAAQTMVPESIANPLLDCRINLEGLLNVLECCRKYDVPHILFSSSAAVYGNNSQIPLQETEPLLPMSPYGITKMASEHYLRIYHDLYGMDATVFRFANVYGERQGEKGEGGVVSIFCKLLSEGKGVTIFGTGKQTRDFVYAGDIARAIAAALPLRGYEVMNISTGKETSLRDLLASFEQAAGHQIKVTYTEVRPGDILRSTLSNSHMKDVLQLVPDMELNAGIARTYAWYKQQRHKL